MNITQENNFCRVFELPDEYPRGFLFGGGKPVWFLMVDWFNPIPQNDLYEGKNKPWSEYVPMLTSWLNEKNYVRPGKRYLLITDFGESLIFGI